MHARAPTCAAQLHYLLSVCPLSPSRRSALSPSRRSAPPLRGTVWVWRLSKCTPAARQAAEPPPAARSRVLCVGVGRCGGGSRGNYGEHHSYTMGNIIIILYSYTVILIYS